MLTDNDITRALFIARACGMSWQKPQRRVRKPRIATPDGLRTPAEAAAKLGCSVKTLRGHVASGALRYVIIGRGTKRPHRMFTAPTSTPSSKLKPARTRHVRLPQPALAILAV